MDYKILTKLLTDYKNSIHDENSFVMMKGLISSLLGNYKEDQNISEFILELSTTTYTTINDFISKVNLYASKKIKDSNDVDIDEMKQLIDNKQPPTVYFYDRKV